LLGHSVETISISQLPSTQFDSIRFQTDPPCWDFALRFLAVHVCGMNKPTYLIAIPGTGFPWYIFLNSLELNRFCISYSVLIKTSKWGFLPRHKTIPQASTSWEIRQNITFSVSTIAHRQCPQLTVVFG